MRTDPPRPLRLERLGFGDRRARGGIDALLAAFGRSEAQAARWRRFQERTDRLSAAFRRLEGTTLKVGALGDLGVGGRRGE